GRGAMLEPFERAAFALKPSEMSGVVKTEAGYHIIKLVDRLPLVAEPLERVYPNVGADAATEQAERIVAARRDRIIRLAHTRALQGKRAELDSLMAGGWRADGVAALWGGFARPTGAAPGKAIVGLGGRAQVASLVFGRDKPPALAVGELSGWVQLDRGLVRVR